MGANNDKSKEFIQQKYIELIEESNLNLHKKSSAFSLKNILFYTGLFSILLIGLFIVLTLPSGNDNFDEYLIQTPYNTNDILLETNKGVFYKVPEKSDYKWLADNKMFISINSDELSFITTKENPKSRTNNYSLWVPSDKQYRLVLTDGTKIKLNANTKIGFINNRNSTTPNIFLHGEAFFEVAPSKNQNFKIQASDMDIEIFGTSFNVSNYQKNDFTSLALIEGSVKVTNPSNESRFVEPGQLAILNKKTSQLIVDKANFNDMLIWTTDQLSFSNEKLESILQKINKWYDVEFIIEESKLKELPFTGSLKREDGVIHFLQMLQYTNHINYTIENNVIRLKTNKN